MLEVSKEFEAIRDLYASTPNKDTLNILLQGEAGAGKTTLLRTAVKPVLLFSFDPHGWLPLKKEIAAGEILVVDVSGKGGYAKFEKTLENYIKQGFFANIGTLVIDSLTSYVFATLRESMERYPSAKEIREARLDPAVPCRGDYQVAGNVISTQVRKCIALPCDFILTAHITPELVDETSGVIKYNLRAFQSIQTELPSIFEDMYVLMKDASGNRFLLTDGMGKYIARSRWNTPDSPVLQTREPADIKGIKQKVGLPTQDKPLFFGGNS